uniref:HTH CENPB-type domain-containing protein n=1 Tax=Globodera rostochiensis TaxID=31243 RepID=A0A914H9R2_GLORO
MSDEDSNEELSQQRDIISKKRRIFTIGEKLEVINFMKSHSIHETSRRFKIDRKRIREWAGQEQKLLSLRETKSGKRLRLDGAGRHLRDKEFDEQMIEWIRSQRACNQRVSRRTIQIHALQIANQADDEETIFKASCGWLNKFMLRHNLRVRISTTVCQKPPIEYEKKLVDFILYIQRQRQSNIYHHIYAADETVVWLDASAGCTKFVQAADVCWNAPFKAKIRQQYEDWMLHGEKTTTSNGNTRAAPMNIYLNWIYEAWEGIPKENISKSFKTCGITNAFDGSEDGEIHCFKKDGPVSNGMLRLQQAREMAEFDILAEGIAGLFEEVDLEQDEENGFVSDGSVEL